MSVSLSGKKLLGLIAEGNRKDRLELTQMSVAQKHTQNRLASENKAIGEAMLQSLKESI